MANYNRIYDDGFKSGSSSTAHLVFSHGRLENTV